MTNPTSRLTRPTPSWLEKAVMYEIYPQTFCDSNGDGIGDIPGIIQKLDYIRSLGVNGIWLNPCFESPFGDAGYDVSDYYKVAPRYGTNKDLVRLFKEADKRGMRVILDLVAGHTSIEHPWFKESSKHERNPYSDWYIWTNSVWEGFGGGQFVRGLSERSGGFMPNFFYFQPALNYGFANPDPAIPWQQPVDAPGPQAVRRELKNIMKYWLDLGASGFRVDMASSLVKGDPSLREISRLWQEFRAWFDAEYPEAILVSEWSEPDIAIPAGYHIDFYIHFGNPGYTSLLRKAENGAGAAANRHGFSFFDASGHGNILEFHDDFYPRYLKSKNLGYVSIPTGNHDITPRLAKLRTLQELEVIYIFLMTMPGVPFIYYGDEIGMLGVENLPSVEGGYNRTEARTPMQWDHSLNAGFSKTTAGSLYTPVENDLGSRTVADQERDPASLLNRVRRLAELRCAHPALCASGEYIPVYARRGECPFVYLRRSGEETVLVAVNPSHSPVDVILDEIAISQTPQPLYGGGSLHKTDGKFRLKLPGIAGGVWKI